MGIIRGFVTEKTEKLIHLIIWIFHETSWGKTRERSKEKSRKIIKCQRRIDGKSNESATN